MDTDAMTSLDPMMTTAAPPVDTSDDDGNAAFYYNLAEKLFIVVDPVITFGGIIGNILMFCVMLRPNQRKMGVSAFMAALAIVDCSVLILDFINNWFKFELKIYLMGMDLGFCVFHRFFFNVAYTFSAWLIVGVSVERFIAVIFPFKAKVICTVNKAIITIVSMFVFIFFYYLYNIWAWHIDADGNCDSKPDWANFHATVTPWLSGALYSYIPIVVLIVLNTMIISKLGKSSARLGKKSNSPGLDHGVNRHVTISVVAICVTFLFLTVPLAIYYIIQLSAGQYIYQGPEMALAETIILILGLSNHAVNCLLYVISSTKFRAELLFMLGLGRFITRADTTTTSGSKDTNKVVSGTNGTDSTNASSGVNKDVSASSVNLQVNPDV